MGYIYDTDLEFLKCCNNDDLDILVKYIIYDKDGKERRTQDMTENKLYKENYPNHKMYYELIAQEIQCFGGNTVANKARGGKGVLYREILEDVCRKLEVKFSNSNSVVEIEDLLLRKVAIDFIKIYNDIGFNIEFKEEEIATLVPQTVKNIMLDTEDLLPKRKEFLKAIGIHTGFYITLDVAGPAYRVTVPAAIQIASMRLKLKSDYKINSYKQYENLLKEDKYANAFSESSMWDKISNNFQKIGIGALYMILLLFYTLKKSSTPMQAKIIIAGALGYVILPLDLLPDAIPGLGYSDDAAALMTAVKTVRQYIDDESREMSKEKLKEWFKNYDEKALDGIEKILNM